MHMPVMDGLEASSRINELNTGIPIVAITANIMTNEKEVYKENGMLDCIGKPFTSQELWRCLMKYLTPVSLDAGQKNMILEADVEFQKSLQLYFVKSNQKRYEEIIKAIEEGDIKLAHRLAHTLKGNAGQLGKMLLQKAAADVERQLKDGKNLVTEDQLKALQNELNAVLTELSYLLVETEDKRDNSAIESLDPQKAKELFRKLGPLLRSGNPDCLACIDELRAIQGCEQLIQQMEDYEFESALKTFENIKERMV